MKNNNDKIVGKKLKIMTTVKKPKEKIALHNYEIT